MSATQRPDLLARLEALPLARPHKRLLVQGGLGYTFDGMDGAIVAFILPVATTVFALSGGQQGLLASSTLIGYFFGALGAGVVGDRIGRKTVMISALGLYAVASVVAAVAPSFALLFAARVVAGVGTGAESAIIAPFLSEFVPSRYRGRFIGSLAGFFAFGFVGAALLGYLVVPHLDAGWRWVQVITALPIVMILWWRRGVPESPRYLLSQGRAAEAEAVVERFERETRRDPAQRAPAAPGDVPVEPEPRARRLGAGLVELWRGALARQTATTWALWFSITFSYYGFFTFIPSLLVKQGLTVSTSFGYSIAIYLAQVPGYYSAAFVSERFDRKNTIGAYLVGGALSALALSQAGSETAVLVSAIVLSFFMNGTYACLYSYTPEVYPTPIRATGMGAASAFGRVGGVLAPIIIGSAYGSLGFSGVFVLTCVVLLAGVLTVLLLGVTTHGRTLEDISRETAR